MFRLAKQLPSKIPYLQLLVLLLFAFLRLSLRSSKGILNKHECTIADFQRA